MKKMMAASRTLIMALAIAATMVVELAMATNYTVGDSGGWEIGANFQSWASSKNFTIGDVLIFEYSANHDVLEVNEPDFSSCSASNPIEKHTGGSTVITLLTSGKRFFICGVPGHCLSGMKVEIDTLATPSPPPSSMATPPSPPPEVTPSSPPPTSSPAAPTSPPASPPKAATKPPAKSPLAPPPDSKASPPAPPTEPTPPSSAPTLEPPIPPFPFDHPLIPSAAPIPPPPTPSSAYKCSFRVHLSVGFTFVVIMLLAL
ncbi:blue copper protein-like [Benincasa hispida]|uniref:blue copper protein-like n=1 Tax=Benincasa hispida TaxID=102211 RepID=UPI0019029C5D|nr:blue copper protein-like [Benincasa hispida]